MANIQDYISQLVGTAAGNIDIPANVKDQVLGGLGDSIFGSLTQTALKQGGLEEIKGIFTGKTDIGKSAVTSLAGSLFTKNILNKLDLGKLGPVLIGLIPGILGKLGGFFKDQDGDGDVDLNDILLTLKGGSSAGGGLLGAATSILGGLFGKKK